MSEIENQPQSGNKLQRLLALPLDSASNELFMFDSYSRTEGMVYVMSAARSEAADQIKVFQEWGNMCDAPWPWRSIIADILRRACSKISLAEVLSPEEQMVRHDTPDRVDMWGRLETVALACGASPDSEIGVEPTGTPASSSNGPREAAGAAGPSEGRVVAVLDEHRRVVADRSGVQWILQARGAIGPWSNRSYCSTKEALIRCCGGNTHELDALPERIQEWVSASEVIPAV